MKKLLFLFFLIAVICIITACIWNKRNSETFDTQESYLRKNGFLVEEGFAIEHYLEAIKVLKAKNINKDNIEYIDKEVLFEEGLLKEVIPFFNEGAKQEKFGIPEPSYYQDTVLVNGQKVVISDINLCYDFLINLLKQDDHKSSPQLANICFAYGVQLSQYKKHEVLYSTAIASQHTAVVCLLEFHKKSGNQQEVDELEVLLEDIKDKFMKFKKSIKGS